MTSATKTTRYWIDEEDQILKNALEQHDEGKEVNWHRVASNIPGRNNKDCRKRWIYGLMPTLNKGPWSKDEDELLHKGVRLHTFKWASVSQVVKTRQPDQCSRRWHESLNPDINHGRWSLLEDQSLKEAVQLYGRKWTEIVERYFPDRTPIAAKNRYAQRFASKQSKTSKTQQDEVADGNLDFARSPGSVVESENQNAEQGPKLLWYMHDYSQKQSTSRRSIDGTCGVGESVSPYSITLGPPTAPLAGALSTTDGVGIYDPSLLDTPQDQSFFENSLYSCSGSSSYNLSDFGPKLWTSSGPSAFHPLAGTSTSLTPSDPNYQHELALPPADAGLQQDAHAPLPYMGSADAVEEWHREFGEGSTVGIWHEGWLAG